MSQYAAMQYTTLAITHHLPAAANIYTQLIMHATGLPNDDLFAKMLASQAMGSGVLPRYLGLNRATFATLFARHFPGANQPVIELATVQPQSTNRYAEQKDLTSLLLEHRADVDISAVWMATIVATACMGGNHLWQDLGLWSRADVTTLMMENFTSLAAQNVADMKWKKFLYKQLCQREGVYVCRAPSCDVCVDYIHCFGAEE
jgi:nitrogen fixation protein NifQ